MPKEGVDKLVFEALSACAADHDVDVVDVEVVGATKAPCIRVRIDHADETAPTISLDEVAAQTGWISETLDEIDPIAGSFTLEVSSPGLSRPLTRLHDFERFAGQTVQLSTIDGQPFRKTTALLKGVQGTAIQLDCDGTVAMIEFDNIKKCTIKPDFSSMDNRRGN